MYRLATVALVIVITPLPTAFGGEAAPVRNLYSHELSQTARLKDSFEVIPVPQPTAPAGAIGHTQPELRVFLLAGDITKAFDVQVFRADAAIMPTNDSLDFDAPFPLTQRILTERIKSDSAAWQRLLGAANQRARPVHMAIDTLPVELIPSPYPGSSTDQRKFPKAACFIATDYPRSGSIAERDFFQHKKLARGIRDCLKSLDAMGLQSVVLPLIGSASGFTTSQMLKNKWELRLLQCRMLNSLAGIGLGINSFLPERTHLREIGIIQYTEDLEKQFFRYPFVPVGKAVSADNISAYLLFARLSVSNLHKALLGDLPKASDLHDSGETCNEIFGFEAAAKR